MYQTIRKTLIGVIATLTLLVTLAAPAFAAYNTWDIPEPDYDKDAQTVNLEYANRVMKQINNRRVNRGLDPIRKYEGCTDNKAQNWAEKLANENDLYHRNLTNIVNDCDMAWVGEALARGAGATPADMVEAFMNSDTHRAVIMKPRAKWAGVGVTKQNGVHYLVVDFVDHTP